MIQKIINICHKYLDFSIFNNDYHIGTSAIANTQLFNETQHMLNVANHNVKRAFELLDHFDQENMNVY